MIGATRHPAFERLTGQLSARLRLRGGFGSRFAVILSGELIQSLFHFVLNVVLVRTLTQRDYGLFAIVFTSGAVGIAYIRALAAVPATLYLSRSLGRPAERGYDVVFGSGAAVIAAAMGLLACGILLPIIGTDALAAGAFIALYAFRSYLRIVLLARKAPKIAQMSDVVYSGLGLALVFAIAALHGGDAAVLNHAFLALAAAHAVGIGVSYAALRSPIRVTFRRSLWRRYFALWRTLLWSLTSITSITVQGQGLTLAFATLVGPAQYAPIAATLVLFAPLRIPTNALTNMVLPEISSLLASQRIGQASRLVIRSTLVIAFGCLLYGAAMWLMLPLVEHYLFSGRFRAEPMNWIGLGVWSAVAVSLLYAIPRAYLEASAGFKTIAWGGIVAVIIGFAIMVPVLLTLPAPVALIGLVASEVATLVWSFAAFRAFARRAEALVLSAADAVAEAQAPTESPAPSRGPAPSAGAKPRSQVLTPLSPLEPV